MLEFQQATLAIDRTVILEDYNFCLKSGSVLAIMGSNGVGKTTLLNGIIGNRQPRSGSIVASGIIGYVPQIFGMPFSYSVLDTVLMGRARYLGLTSSPGQRDFELAHHYLEWIGMDSLSQRDFNHLSGGQRQLVMIAQALCSECNLLVLDEPCSALDYYNQASVLEKICLLNQQMNLTVVFSTHMPQHALEVASHALLIKGRTDYLYGKISEILNETNLSELYRIDVAKALFINDHTITLAPRFRTAIRA